MFLGSFGLTISMKLSPDFLYSLKWYSAWRWFPRKFILDNGATFKGSAKILKAVMSSSEVQAHLQGVGIEWSFNLEKARWWGGMFERLIKSTKRCLWKMIDRAKLSYDELNTLLTEIEVVINSRPLMTSYTLTLSNWPQDYKCSRCSMLPET